MKLKYAGDSDTSKYWVKAEQWAGQQNWQYYMQDKFAAIKGVAEFLANQDGLIIFFSYVGRSYEKV